MAGKGGGAWKVAYADFVTAMMAFFLVMWIVGQSKAVKQAVAGYFKDPMGYSKMSSGGSPVMPSNKPGDPPGPSLLPSTKPGSAGGGDGPHMGRSSSAKDDEPPNKNKESEQKQPSLFAIHSGNRRYMGTMILFGENSTGLDQAAKDLLMPIISELRGKPQKIEIRGHAARSPQTPGDSRGDPWKISYERSLATMKFFVDNGIEPKRIRLSQGGAYEPYSLQSDPAMQTHNSRVEVYVLDEYAENLMGTPEETRRNVLTTVERYC